MIARLLNERHKNLIFIFLFISLTLVCIPRFDRADYGFIKVFVGKEDLYEGLPYDILIYKNYIEYFRGEKNENGISPPYTYRILIPFIASKLPFEPLTSLNLINLFFLYLGTYFLYLLLRRIKIDFPLSIIGCLIFIFSFPVFYYGTSGYIDASFVGLLTGAIYFIVSRKFLLFYLVMITGTLANEKMVIIFPFLIAYLYVEKVNIRSSLTVLFISGTIYLVVSYLLRTLTPSGSQPYVWIPGSLFIFQNIYRAKTYISFIITFGIPGILATISFFRFSKEEVRRNLYFYIGCLTSVLLYIYSIFAAWSDGRTIWTIYPFAIPVAMLFLQEKFKSKKNI